MDWTKSRLQCGVYILSFYTQTCKMFNCLKCTGVCCCLVNCFSIDSALWKHTYGALLAFFPLFHEREYLVPGTILISALSRFQADTANIKKNLLATDWSESVVPSSPVLVKCVSSPAAFSGSVLKAMDQAASTSRYGRFAQPCYEDPVNVQELLRTTQL